MVNEVGKTAVMLVFLWMYAFCGEQTFAQVNLALHMPAYDSSSAFQTHAEMANDGNRIQFFQEGTCTHTGLELAPWWTVDLRGNYSIHSLRIYNRDGTCRKTHRCAERLIGFRVHVSDEINATIPSTRFKYLCHLDNETTMPLIIDVHCTSPLVGRYVTISVNRTTAEFFTLCEVEVYGPDATNPVSVSTSLPLSSQQWSSDDRTTSETSPGTTDEIRLPDTENPASISLPSTSLQLWSSDERTSFETVPLYTGGFTVDVGDQVSPTSSYVDWIEISTAHTPEMTTYDEASFTSHIPEMTSTERFSDYMVSSVTKRKPCCCSLRRPASVTELISHNFISSILKDLDIERKNVTQQRRKYISMPDERKSSLAISVSFLGVTLALCAIMLCDVKKVLQTLSKSTEK